MLASSNFMPPSSKPIGRALAKESFHHGDLEKALVAAALSVLKTRSVGELSLREVARIAGVSNGAPYRHYKRRADLLVAVALEGFAELDRILQAVDSAPKPASERLEQRVLAYMRFAISHGAHYRVMFSPELREAESAAAYDRAAGSSFHGLVAAVLAVQPSLGARATELALVIWSSAHGAALLAIDGTFEGLAERRKTSHSLLAKMAKHLTHLALIAPQA